jgi:hypothetical protein
MKLKKKVETICPHCSEVVTDRCMKFECIQIIRGKKLENKIELMIYDVEEQLKSILKREWKTIEKYKGKFGFMSVSFLIDFKFYLIISL